MAISVLALSCYGALGASSRMRIFQYLPALAASGVQVKVKALFPDAMLAVRYERGRYDLGAFLVSFSQRISALLRRNAFDLLWIEKEVLPWLPFWAEAVLLRDIPYVLDYDDAVFHNYDLHPLGLVRHVFGQKHDALMAGAKLVVCGNDYLAQRARNAGSQWVEVIPTVIDLGRYPKPHLTTHLDKTYPPAVVWIGSPSTVPYLRLLQAPLQVLAQRLSFRLRVICCDFAMPGVHVESIPWSLDTEVASIAAGAVGVMPLRDSPWERGKCGYKLIQYMACGLPVVASPVGVNISIVKEGVNGFLAEDAQTWLARLEHLLRDEVLRNQLGAAGRESVEYQYCLQVAAPRLSTCLLKAARIQDTN